MNYSTGEPASGRMDIDSSSHQVPLQSQPPVVTPPQCPYRRQHRPSLINPPAFPVHALPYPSFAPFPSLAEPTHGSWNLPHHWQLPTAHQQAPLPPPALFLPPGPLPAAPTADSQALPPVNATSPPPRRDAGPAWEAWTAQHRRLAFTPTLSHQAPPDNHHGAARSEAGSSSSSSSSSGSAPTTAQRPRPGGGGPLPVPWAQPSSTPRAAPTNAPVATHPLPPPYVLPLPHLPRSLDGDFDVAGGARRAPSIPAPAQPTSPQTANPIAAADSSDADRTPRGPRARRSNSARRLSLRRERPSDPRGDHLSDMDFDDYLRQMTTLLGYRDVHDQPGWEHERRATIDAPRNDPAQTERAMAIARGARASLKPIPTQAAIASLESVDVETLPEDERICVICYNAFGQQNPEGDIENPLRLPKCKHVFGDACIKRWFQDSDSCPYCREKLPSELPSLARPWLREMAPSLEAAYAMFMNEHPRSPRRDSDTISEYRRRASVMITERLGQQLHSGPPQAAGNPPMRDILEPRRRPRGRGGPNNRTGPAAGARSLHPFRASRVGEASPAVARTPLHISYPSDQGHYRPTLFPPMISPARGRDLSTPAIFNHSNLPNNQLQVPLNTNVNAARQERPPHAGNSSGFPRDARASPPMNTTSSTRFSASPNWDELHNTPPVVDHSDNDHPMNGTNSPEQENTFAWQMHHSNNRPAHGVRW